MQQDQDRQDGRKDVFTDPTATSQPEALQAKTTQKLFFTNVFLYVNYQVVRHDGLLIGNILPCVMDQKQNSLSDIRW